MKKAKKYVGILAALALVFGAIGCSSDDEDEKQEPEVVLQIEEGENSTTAKDGFVSTTGAIKTSTDFVGYSKAYIDGLGDNSKVVYSVKAEKATTVKLAVKYALWSDDIRGIIVTVNGSCANDGKAIYTPTTLIGNKREKGDERWIMSGWLENVSLKAGDNSIILTPAEKASAQSFNGTSYSPKQTAMPNIDYLQIIGKGISAGSASDETSYYSVKYSSENTNYGTVSANISSGLIVVSGTEITLTATPNEGYKFDSWVGTHPSTSAEYTITVSQDVSVSAHFIPTNYQNEGLYGYATVSDDEGTAYTITGGTGGTEITISNLEDLKTNKSKLSSNDPYIFIVSGLITTAEETFPNVSLGFDIGSNKTLKSGTTQGRFQNIGFKLQGKNVIIQNLQFGEVIADEYFAKSEPAAKAAKMKRGAADAMEINGAEHIWIDHCEFQSHLTPMAFNENKELVELTFDINKTNIKPEKTTESPEIAWRKDYYDGLLDIKNNARFITISNCYFHDHYKACLCGSNDTDSAEFINMRVTFYYNYWKNINARTPLFRFGKAHVFSSYFVTEAKNDATKWLYMSDDSNGDSYTIGDNVQSTAINCRAASELYIDNNYFENLKTAVGHYNGTGDVPGTWTTKNNEGFADTTGNSYVPPYTWSSAVKSASDSKTYVVANAGPKLN